MVNGKVVFYAFSSFQCSGVGTLFERSAFPATQSVSVGVTTLERGNEVKFGNAIAEETPFPTPRRRRLHPGSGNRPTDLPTPGLNRLGLVTPNCRRYNLGLYSPKGSRTSFRA